MMHINACIAVIHVNHVILYKIHVYLINVEL